MRRGLLVSLLVLAGCGSSGANPSQDYATYASTPDPVSTVAPLAQPATDVVPITPAKPSHNYDAKDGLVYSYIAAVSEEQRKAGRAAGDVVSYTYLGVQQGRHVLARVGANGYIQGYAYCPDPCRVITYDDGSQVGFTETSVIGAAFADAIGGRLRQAALRRPAAQQTFTPPPNDNTATSAAPQGSGSSPTGGDSFTDTPEPKQGE